MIAALLISASLTITPSARTMQPGELVVLNVSSDVPLSAVRARAFNTDIIGFAVDAAIDSAIDSKEARQWQLLIGIDLDATVGRHVVEVSATSATGSLSTTYQITVLAKKFPTRRLTVDPAFVNPPPAALPRIAAEVKEQQAIWNAPSPSRLWSAPFVRPVTEAANSAFGTRSVFNGQARSAHGGADFLSPSGTPVKAPNAGRVALAKHLYYSGNTVIIDHGLGVFSFLAHLSRIDVAAGATVLPGQVIGAVGATGRVTGPHLHWTVRVSNARVDPLSLLALLGPAAPRR